MQLLKLYDEKAEAVLALAVEILKNGGIIAYPTETFYGLGAKFDIDDALRKIYEMKHRPRDKPMPLIIGEKQTLSAIVSRVSSEALYLMDTFWPGPLTLILHAKEDVLGHITAGTRTVAVRIPGKSFALRLAQTARFPFTATSANISGLPPARDAETVVGYFGENIDLVIDAGPTPGVLPSTVVDARGTVMKVLREGMIDKNKLEGP